MEGNNSNPELDAATNEPRAAVIPQNLFLPKECYRFFEYKAYEKRKKLGYTGDLQFEFRGESLLSLGTVLRSYIKSEIEKRIGINKGSISLNRKVSKDAFLNKKFKNRRDIMNIRNIQKIQKGIAMKDGRINPLIVDAENRVCLMCRMNPVRTPCLCDKEQTILGFDNFLNRLLFCSEECHVAYHEGFTMKNDTSIDVEINNDNVNSNNKKDEEKNEENEEIEMKNEEKIDKKMSENEDVIIINESEDKISEDENSEEDYVIKIDENENNVKGDDEDEDDDDDDDDDSYDEISEGSEPSVSGIFNTMKKKREEKKRKEEKQKEDNTDNIEDDSSQDKPSFYMPLPTRPSSSHFHYK